MSSFTARRALRVAPALIIAALAACADDNVAPPAAEAISAVQAQRIAVTDAGTATLRVLSADDGAVARVEGALERDDATAIAGRQQRLRRVVALHERDVAEQALSLIHI